MNTKIVHLKVDQRNRLLAYESMCHVNQSSLSQNVISVTLRNDCIAQRYLRSAIYLLAPHLGQFHNYLETMSHVVL